MQRKYKNLIWAACKHLLGRQNYERFRFYYNLRYFPDLKNPKSFNEKICHMKLYGNMDSIIHLVDKYDVHQYVKDKIGEEFLTPIYYVGDDMGGVDWSALPNGFVVKTTQSGGEEGNVIVYDKAKTDTKDIVDAMEQNLQKKFGYWTSEDFYLRIKPRVIIEELMLDEQGRVPNDYKFFCFNGKCHFIQVNSDRYHGHHRSFYSTDWVLQDFVMGHIPSAQLDKPENLNDMIEVAEKLSEDFDFVRVDLYSLNGDVRFGELTFTPNSGWDAFHPREKDYEYGALMK